MNVLQHIKSKNTPKVLTYCLSHNLSVLCELHYISINALNADYWSNLHSQHFRMDLAQFWHRAETQNVFCSRQINKITSNKKLTRLKLWPYFRKYFPSETCFIKMKGYEPSSSSPMSLTKNLVELVPWSIAATSGSILKLFNKSFLSWG